MSDRSRPHNIGQVLFESLGAGLGAFGSFLEQERIRKSQTQQQSFLNQLRVESAGRDVERLGLERERVGLQRERDLLSSIGKTSPNPFFEEGVSPQDQALIDLRNAQRGKTLRQTELLGRGGQQQIPLGSFIQNFLGGRQQIVPGTEESLFPVTAPAPITPQAVDSLGALIQQLQGFGQSQVFPDTSGINAADFLPARDLDLAEAEGQARQWAESGGISDWASLPESTKQQIIEQLIREGIPGANR